MLRRFSAISGRANRSLGFRSPPADLIAGSLLLLLAASLAGCSSKQPADRKAVFPVRGKLLIDNQPAPGAMVIFHPVGASSQTERPFGKVSTDGTFELTTYEGQDGAPAGEYVVTTEWQLSADRDAPGPWPNVLPPEFSDPNRSPLKLTIAPAPNELQPISISPVRR